MVLKGVDEIDWFTDRPYRSEGLWRPRKLISQWDSLFETSDPNAQASFRIGDEREIITFEMFKPRHNKRNQKLSFKIDAEIVNKRESDIITGLKGKALDEVTLFIDDATLGASNSDSWAGQAVIGLMRTFARNNAFALANLNLSNGNLAGMDLTNASLTNTDLSNSSLMHADLGGANLSGANLSNANLFNAQLNRADLTNANLTNADLSNSWLVNANLNGAALDGAKWSYTFCPNGEFNSGTSPCTAEQLNLA